MLDRNYYLKEFVNQLAKINGGRVFYTTPDQAGRVHPGGLRSAQAEEDYRSLGIRRPQRADSDTDLESRSIACSD